MPLDKHKHIHNKRDLKEGCSIKHNKENLEITINIIYNI
jgi:hypothetical protein